MIQHSNLPGLTRLETVLAAQRLSALDTEPSNLYTLRGTALVGQFSLLSCTIDMIFGRK